MDTSTSEVTGPGPDAVALPAQQLELSEANLSTATCADLDDWEDEDAAAVAIGRNLAMFNTMDRKNEGCVRARTFQGLMDRSGIPRKWSRRARKILDPAGEKAIAFERFHEMFTSIEHSAQMEKALLGTLIVPDFESFTQEVTKICEEVREIRDGVLPTYIPQLTQVDPELFGVSIQTVDGQEWSWGDHATNFTMQSTAKPITYCMVERSIGSKKISKYVGHEPSGKSFDDFGLNSENKPPNPLMNSGAIVVCSLFKPGVEPSERFDATRRFFARMAPETNITFDNACYLSESNTADRNFALAHYMKGSGCFPERVNTRRALEEVLLYYIQTCSIQVTTKDVAALYAVLANGGVQVGSEKKVVADETCQNILSLMQSCGMYDYSGEFAYSIGQPAKSGISGCVVMVVPKKMAVCVYSPLLDANGNSTRAVAFFRRFAARFAIHQFTGATSGSPFHGGPAARSVFGTTRTIEYALLHAASCGDMPTMRCILATGVAVDCTDMDGHSALHLAAKNGRSAVVEFLISCGADLNLPSKTRTTPLELALLGGHEMIGTMLTQAGATPVTREGKMARILSMRKVTRSRGASMSMTGMERFMGASAGMAAASSERVTKGEAGRERSSTIASTPSPTAAPAPACPVPSDQSSEDASEGSETGGDGKVKKKKELLRTKTGSGTSKVRAILRDPEALEAEFGAVKAQKLLAMPAQMRLQAIVQMRKSAKRF